MNIRTIRVIVILLSALHSVCCTGSRENKLESIAIKAARAAGCMGTYDGPLETRVTSRTSCFAGGFVQDVLLIRKCEEESCANVRLAPFAKVVFRCDLNPIVTGLNCKVSNLKNRKEEADLSASNSE